MKRNQPEIIFAARSFDGFCLGGIIAAGVFLILVALLGVFGTKNQDQAALFFVSEI